MSWLDKLEKRLGFLAIPGLIRFIIGFTVLVYLLVYLNRGFESFLTLDPARIMKGEIWRLVTYIFVPQTFSPLWLLLALWFLWFIGEGLERAWGAFRLTLYFLVGMIGTTAAAFFFGANFSNGMLIVSLFFAFARFYPEEIIYILFILPMKIKWLAWIMGAFLLFGFVVNGMSYRMALVAAFAELSDLLRPGNYSRSPASHRSLGPAQTFRITIDGPKPSRFTDAQSAALPS